MLYLLGIPFEKMDAFELRRELHVQRWFQKHFKQMVNNCQYRLEETYKEMEDETFPMEKIKEMYERGEITKEQKKTLQVQREHKERKVRGFEDIADYCVMYEQHARAEKLRIHQRLEDLKYAKVKTFAYDPRRRETKYNKREWKTGDIRRRHFKNRAEERYFREVRNRERSAMQRATHASKIPGWNKEKLKQIAYARGYRTDAAIYCAIGEATGLTQKAVSNLLGHGRLKMTECMVIGAIFEMTPKEWADVFTPNYFKETPLGNYVAYLDDYSGMLNGHKSANDYTSIADRTDPLEDVNTQTEDNTKGES